MSAKKRFESLDSLRHGVLDRARQAAALTIPSLLPELGLDENSQLPQPYQSLGARGVNNLASKLLLALMPTTNAFFRLSVDADVLDQVPQKDDLEDILRRRENKVMKFIERGNLRAALFNALKLLIVVGNALVYMPKVGPTRSFRFDQYVVVRDPNGVVIETYIREEADPVTIPAATRDACQVKLEDSTSGSPLKNVKIYTAIKLREGGKMVDYWQEINDIEVPGSRGAARADESPYMVLRWTAVDGENYGRGHVEEYIGDLRSLEGLSMAIVGFSAVAAKIIFLVHPNATTSVDDLVAASTGDFVTGSLKDLEVLQLDKYADFKVSQEVLRDLIIRLSHAFLLQSGTTRDAERVTAEEVRAQAQELEDVLGGVYTVQSQELQLPLVRRVVHVMEETGELERIDKRAGIEPTIITGFEALGRGHELNRIRNFLADAAASFGPDVLREYIKVGDGLKKFAVAHNIDFESLIKSDEEVMAAQAKQQQQQMQQEMLSNAAGPAAGAAIKGASDYMNK
jgi:hypothetical protein